MTIRPPLRQPSRVTAVDWTRHSHANNIGSLNCIGVQELRLAKIPLFSTAWQAATRDSLSLGEIFFPSSSYPSPKLDTSKHIDELKCIIIHY